MHAYERYKAISSAIKESLALSIYNEGLEIAIRRGAPLASYSIDGTCLKEYMKHLTHADTAI